MNYPEFKKDLQRIHESEVYGKAVFETAANLTSNVERKKKWLTLKALEEKTLDRYLSFMKETGRETIDPKIWMMRGYAEGAALGLLPWRLAMKLVRDATGPFQESFLRLKNNADPSQKPFFDYVYAHELAIESFAKKELKRDKTSLDAVEKLLEP